MIIIINLAHNLVNDKIQEKIHVCDKNKPRRYFAHFIAYNNFYAFKSIWQNLKQHLFTDWVKYQCSDRLSDR